MKTTTDKEKAKALQRALPGTSGAEIKKLQEDATTLQDLRMFHGEFLDSITGLFYKHDIEGLAFDDRDLEYEGEAAKILMKLPKCTNAGDCQRVIHSEMVQAFDGRVKPIREYAALAQDVWQEWAGVVQEIRQGH